MEFRILGPLEVVDNGRSLPLGGARQRALLTALILRANQVVSTDQLLDEVWSDEPPASGVRVVQVYVSQLRKILGDGVIETRAPGYVLTAKPDTLDLQRFEALLGEARKADPAEAAAKLRDALALWRRAPLGDVAYHSFAQTEIGRLEELRLSAFEARIEADLRLGRHAEVVGELEALVAEHPLRERLRAHLMQALYGSGRQAEALEAYQQARNILVEELGIEPGRGLRDLEQAILRQDPSLDVAADEEAEEDSSRGAFVGREAELEELLAGLEDTLAGRGRLFLVVGEPGIGKSRLTEELMRRARARGARVLVGRCWEAGGAPAYWPWVQSLRGYVRGTDPGSLRAQLGSGAAEVAQILPELHELLPGLPEPTALDSEGARFRLFDATAEFLRAAAEERPTLLVLDDLHAADMPSLLLLQFVARELASSRLLVIGALRDVDPVPGHALSAVLAELAREPVTRRLALGGLSEEDIGEYVALTASEIASPDLVSALHERTEGNPLFVGETVRLLAFERDDPGPSASPAVIPQSVRDVIARSRRSSTRVIRYPARPVFRCVFTHLQMLLGRLPEARGELTALAADDFAAMPFDSEWLYGMSMLAETCIAVGDAESAPVLYRLLLPWAALNAADHPEGIRGSVSRYLGLLATAMADWPTAQSHFEAALAMNERMGARPWLAHTQRDYARMLLERAEAGDRERATDLLESATAIYGELGMTVA